MKLEPHLPPPCARGCAQTSWSLHSRMKERST